MAFVNERIPETDVEKYELAEIDSRCYSATKSREWTVDRKRNVYLREVVRPFREHSNKVTRWTFFWKGDLLGLDHKVLEASGPCWTHARITNFKIPSHLAQHCEEIHNDLREAFLAYRTGGGVFAACAESNMQLDIEETSYVEVIRFVPHSQEYQAYALPHSGENITTFVNERIPEADFEKYGLAEIGRKFHPTYKRRDWTVDRERNIYLREVADPIREASDQFTQWTFFWKGTLLWYEDRGIALQGGLNQPCWSHIKVSKFDIPEHLRSHREEIYNDLREALLAYRTGGVFATCTEFTMQLDIEE